MDGTPTDVTAYNQQKCIFNTPAGNKCSFSVFFFFLFKPFLYWVLQDYTTFVSKSNTIAFCKVPSTKTFFYEEVGTEPARPGTITHLHISAGKQANWKSTKTHNEDVKQHIDVVTLLIETKQNSNNKKTHIAFFTLLLHN